VAHLPPDARALFSTKREAVRRQLVQALQQLGHAKAESIASSMQAEMVGALALARACTDEAEARQMLEVTRQAVKLRAGLVTA
jgi:TetR/AcrR family transcriptional regulator, transcriptional repressor for nem operon